MEGVEGPTHTDPLRDAIAMPKPAVRPPLRRPIGGRVIGGVAMALAIHLGIPVGWVRIAFVVISVIGGWGLLPYLALWALIPQDDGGALDASAELAAGRRTGRPATSDAAHRKLRQLFATPDEELRTLVVGVGLIVAAGMLFASRFTDAFRPSVVIAVAVTLAGAALGLSQLDRSERERWLAPVSLTSTGGLLRVAGGLLLVVAGLVVLLAPTFDPAVLLTIAVSTVAVLGGVALVLGPWALRLWRDLESERQARIRERERAEIAAHLHDSVLQTLALIQRRSSDAGQVARLARAQERQLREYLYGATPSDGEDETLAAAVRRICGEVEDAEGVAIELVVVGDRPVSAAGGALVQAFREALLNAARHGRTGISVFVESMGEAVDVFVRDRGPGFDLDSMPTDRLGVRESVIGRMERAGGSARIRRHPGGGTEVILTLREPDPTGMGAH